MYLYKSDTLKYLWKHGMKFNFPMLNCRGDNFSEQIIFNIIKVCRIYSLNSGNT